MVLRICNQWTVSAVLVALLFSGTSEALSAAAKSKKVTSPPDLKIVSVDAAPLPYVPNRAPLTLTIMIELPKTIPADALLDITTFITSASRSSFRLLSTRRALSANQEDGKDPAGQASRRLEIIQTWDGTDNNARTVSEGLYDYQVQAKLMVPNKSGAPLTRITAWKKRGNIQVKADSSAQSD